MRGFSEKWARYVWTYGRTYERRWIQRSIDSGERPKNIQIFYKQNYEKSADQTREVAKFRPFLAKNGHFRMTRLKRKIIKF